MSLADELDTMADAYESEGYPPFTKCDVKTLHEAAKRLRAIGSKDFVRFCPDCGHVGEVGANHISCCPDGDHRAQYEAAGTLEGCLEYFRSHQELKSKFSDNLEEKSNAENPKS